MRKLSLGQQVFLAVVLGIAAGIFFGPMTGALKPIGEVYTMLLQMAVLPYMCLSLIHGLGSLTPDMGKKLFRSGWPYLLALWVITFSLIFLLVQLIPNTQTPLIDTEASNDFENSFSKNFLSYLVPQNPFYDLSHNVVPAVAVLGLISGVALMHVARKDPLIDVLERINQTIEKILYWLGVLSPIGAFTYIAIAFGTIHFEDFYRLQFFMFAFVLTTLFITFWILPTLLSSLTPLSFREASKAFRYVCLLPFVTGLPTMALPFLTAYLRQLSQNQKADDQFRATSQTVLPIAYSFGNIGNAMILFFIIFLGYYYRHPLSNLDEVLLTVLTIPLSIGATTGTANSVVFLTKQLGLPAASFDFFLEIRSVIYNFQVMMSIAGVLTLIILTLYSYYGLLQLQLKRCFFRIGSSIALFAVFVVTTKALVHPTDVYEHLYMHFKIGDVIRNPVAAKILAPGEEGTARTFGDPTSPNTLQQILTSRVLKVGFNTYSIPFCYYNSGNELVGFDIAYAYQLAEDLGCTIEFVPLDFDRIAEELTKGSYDIGMSSIIMSETRIAKMEFTAPYWEDNNVLVISRKKKNQFLKLSELQQRQGLRIGAGGAQVQITEHYFPRSVITNTSETTGLTNGTLDALLWSETSSNVWCISNPEYVGVSYGDQLGKTYFGYPVRQYASDFGFFLNNWLSLKKQSGFEMSMRDYWIDGVEPGKRPPRWSILGNLILHRKGAGH